MTTPGGPGQPTALSPDQVDLLKRARDAAWPLGRISTYDDFAKWIFTSAAVVGTLGAAFANTAFKSLSTVGTLLFAVALLATSVALATAVLSRHVDFRIDTNYETLAVLTDAELVMGKKRRLIRISGLSFTVALLFAGLAPVSSAWQFRAKPSLQFAITKDVFHVAYNGWGDKGKEAEMRVVAPQGNGQILLGMQRITIGSDRTMRFDLTRSSLPDGLESVRLVFLCDVSTGNVRELIIPVKQPQATRSSALGEVCK